MSTNRMFRLSDPLGNYSSDPRHGQGVRSPVVAYQPVQETSKPSSSKFWLTVSLLVLLISSLFFLVVLRRQKDGDISEPIDDIPRGECIECIDFDKVSNVLTDSKNVEKYLQEKLSNITRINIATGDSNRSLEGYKDKHGQVGSLQDKVSQLVSLKEKFEKAVKEAAVIENRLKTMKGEYDKKLNKIEEFGNKSLNTVRQVDIQKKNIKDWENDLNGVHGTLTVTDKGLKEKKIEFYDKLTKINKQIEGELSRAGFTEDQLEAFLERKQNGIRQIKGEKYDCEESNKKKQEDIDELKRKNQTLSKELFRIEYEKKSKRMQIHSLKTAQKLEKLLEELYNLQKSSAEEAKQYLDDIVQSIESKIKEYEEITSGKGGHKDDYKTKAAEDLQHAIKQEKKLLKEWMGEQIKSLRVSNEEIKNMTSYLEETNNQITGGRKELEELLASEERVRAELKRIPSQIEELLRGINDCNLVIERSKKQVEKENEEVDKVADLQSRIAKLRSEMKEEQKKFVNQEEGSSGSRNTLALEEQSLEEDIKKARRDIESAEYNVKHFATEINELLKKEPANEDVKREEKRYQDKMNIVIDTNTQIETLVKEIKKLL